MEQAVLQTKLKRCSSPKSYPKTSQGPEINPQQGRHTRISQKLTGVHNAVNSESRISLSKPQAVVNIYRSGVGVAHLRFCRHPASSGTPCGRSPGASRWAPARTSAPARPGCSREDRPALFAAPPADGPLPGECIGFTLGELLCEEWQTKPTDLLQ